MTLGTGSVLMARDSSLVTLTFRPGNWMGSMPLVQQGVDLLVEAGGVGHPCSEDSGGLDGQRAVDIDREAAVAGDKILSLISRMK